MKGRVDFASVTMHPLATCDECNWRAQRPAATNAARAHVKETGHAVTVDRVTRSRYWPGESQT